MTIKSRCYLLVCRNQSSLPAVYGRNMQAKGKMALPRGRKKWSQETSLSVLKKFGNSSSGSKGIRPLNMRSFEGKNTVQFWGCKLISMKGSQLRLISILLKSLSYNFSNVLSLHKKTVMSVLLKQANRKEQQPKRRPSFC